MLNIDGLPLFRRSKNSLWPILLKPTNIPQLDVFPVGVYLGKQKPFDVEDYLESFVDEFNSLKENGLQIDDEIYDVFISGGIFDAPAKAFVCCIPYHSSANGCPKCTQVAKKIRNTLTFETKTGHMITDEDFEKRNYMDHHQRLFLDIETPLERMGIKMITQIPMDPMHLIDLGVTKKMISKLVKKKVNFKFEEMSKMRISVKLEQIKRHITKEFVRLPRSFEDIPNWKATEFRQFLLYTGVVALKENVGSDFYYLFLLLHSACRLLSNPRASSNQMELAEEMLKNFVENFPIVFGPDSVSYNVHGLLHICDSVKEHGALYNFSAYAFENHLQIMKNNVRKPTHILQQLFNANLYTDFAKVNKKKGFQRSGHRIKCYTTDEYYFSCKSPDNKCLISPYIPFKIEKFKTDRNGDYIVGRRFKNIKPFFTIPCDSITELGICEVDNTLDENEESFNVDEINRKLMCLPRNNSFILLPILHGCTA